MNPAVRARQHSERSRLDALIVHGDQRLHARSSSERDSLISKHEFYVGIGLAGNRTQFNYIGGELLFRSKRKKVYGIGLGLNQTLEPVISARMMWKLGKK